MAQVFMPTRQSKKSEFEQLLPIAGAVAGGMVGGPGGAMTGASIGSQLPGFVNPQDQQAQPQQVETALSRRKMQLDQTPLSQIRDSIDSLKYVKDDQTRMELAKPLLEADYMARQKGQV